MPPTATLPPLSTLLRPEHPGGVQRMSISSGSSSPPLSPRTPAADPEGDTPRPMARGSFGSTTSSPGLGSLSLETSKRRPPPLSLHPLPPLSSLPERKHSPGGERRSISSLLNGSSGNVALPAPYPSSSRPNTASQSHFPNSSRPTTTASQSQYAQQSPRRFSSMDVPPGSASRPSPDHHFAYAPPPPHTASSRPVEPTHYHPPPTAPVHPSEMHYPPEIDRRHSYQPVEYYAHQGPPAYYHHGPYEGYPPVGHDGVPFTGLGSRAPISRTTRACDNCRSRKVRCDAGGGHPGGLSTCSRCRESGRVCVYSATQKKRGPCPGQRGQQRLASVSGDNSRPASRRTSLESHSREEWERAQAQAQASSHAVPIRPHQRLPHSAPAHPVEAWPWSGSGGPTDERYHPYSRPQPVPPHQQPPPLPPHHPHSQASHPHAHPPPPPPSSGRERPVVGGWDNSPHQQPPLPGPPPPPGAYGPEEQAPRHEPLFDSHYAMRPHPSAGWPVHGGPPNPSYPPPPGAHHPAHPSPHATHMTRPPPHAPPPPPPPPRAREYYRRSVSPPPPYVHHPHPQHALVRR